MNRRIALALTAVVTLSVGAASCRDDDSGGDTSSDRKVVTIGVIAPLEAGLTSFGHGIESSVRLAAEEANARDAIPGFEIEVVAEDDSSDPEKGAPAAEAIAEDDTVIGVVGTYNSGVAAEAAPVLNRAGIPMISPANTDPALTIGADRAKPARPYDTYFRMVASDAQQGPFLAEYAYEELAARTVAIVSETKDVSRGLANDFSAAFEAMGGTVAHDTTVPDGTTEFGDAVGEIAPLDPDLLFFGGEYQVAASFRTAAAAIDAPVMGGDGMKDDAYVDAAGAEAMGDFASTVGTPLANLKSKSAQEFRDDYEAAEYPDPATDFGPYAYDAANLLIEAAAAALEGEDAVTAAVRKEIVESVQAADVEGLTGPIAFDEFGDTTTKVLTIYSVMDKGWSAILTREVS